MADQRASPLLALPAEIRNTIYEMVFEGACLKLDSFKAKYPPESIGLLPASQQTFEEAINIYYSHLTVSSCFAPRLVDWASKLPRKYLRQIPKIRYDVADLSSVGYGGPGIRLHGDHEVHNERVLKAVCRRFGKSGSLFPPEQFALTDSDNVELKES